MSLDNPQDKLPAGEPPAKLRRECFVTIGATAGFEELLAASVSEQTLLKLKKFDYTHLTIQVGDLEDFFNRTKPKDTKGIVVKSFTFKRDGLTHNMKKCRAKPGVSEEGLVICHAGSGTILDGMRLGVPLVVVPNTSLLDNHQDELADELEAQGYVTKGSPSTLAVAIEKASQKAARSWGHSSAKRGNFAAIVDEVCDAKEEDAKSRFD